MKILPKYIQSYTDLVTTKDAIKHGFLQQALQKIDKTEPYIKRAIEMRTRIKTTKNIVDLLKLSDIREELLMSAGFSTKAMSHIARKEQDDLLQNALKVIHDKHGDDFHDEILFRYLLIAGDSLGGSMRNLTGSLGQRILASTIVNMLEKKNIRTIIGKAFKGNKIQSIAWKNRCIVFDRTPHFIGNNIDLILLNSLVKNPEVRIYNYKGAYIACGELKGGIDPAGADEHWKTARSALDRIKQSFDKNKCPALFFVAAAIEAAMAKEIFSRLQTGELSFAANLTVEKQVDDLASWLISL
ncbi:MAG: type II site-specific deoxyribonuclease [Candidatus Omnitrophica bacterium]|nr:type II site-specific deoxyribonuclease [Candidatus Omnitrophota bacterium]